MFFKCKNKENGQIANPPLEEVSTALESLFKKANFYTRCLRFGTFWGRRNGV